MLCAEEFNDKQARLLAGDGKLEGDAITQHYLLAVVAGFWLSSKVDKHLGAYRSGCLIGHSNAFPCGLGIGQNSK